MENAVVFSARRLMISVIFGVVAGFICFVGGLYFVGFQPTATIFLWIVLNRAMIGFAIGISALRMHWALHGMLIGLIVGSIFLFYAHMKGEASALVLVAIGLLNPLFGLMIEFFASVVFAARPAAPA